MLSPEPWCPAHVSAWAGGRGNWSGTDGDYWQGRAPFPDRDGLCVMLFDPAAAVFEANVRFKYTNVGYGLLGLVLESATGTPYAELVRSRILDRVGLGRTGPDLDVDRSAEYAVAYSSLAYAETRRPIDPAPKNALAPATGFFSNALDLVVYFSAHFLGDDRLLTDASKRQMQHPVWDSAAPEEGQRYALGLGVDRIGERTVIGHGGGWPGHITWSFADTTAGLAVSVLANAMEAQSSSLAAACVKLVDLAGRQPRPGAPIDLSPFVGRFVNLYGVVDVAPLGGRLFALSPSEADPASGAVPLEIIDDHTLRFANEQAGSTVS